MAPEREHKAADRPKECLRMAMEEILGTAGVQAVQEHAEATTKVESGWTGCPPAWQVQTALQDLYGFRAGRGLTLRIGRSCFIHMLRAFGSEVGLTDPSFRLLPLPLRLLKGGEMFAFLFKELSARQVHQKEDDSTITWKIASATGMSGGWGAAPVCMLAVGFLQEALTWLSAGKVFQVEERSVPACGASGCTIVIDRVPAGR